MSVALYKHPPKKMLRLIGRAVSDYAMIQEGDKVVLGLSGGKDSMTLLHVLMYLQAHAPIKFDLAAVTICPMIETFNPKPLEEYLKQLEVPYQIVEFPMEESAKKHMNGKSFCSWCARMKRGLLYSTVRNKGFNVLALGQHLDDLAESFMMSAFHEGKLNTMKACYQNDAKDIKVIRPLSYVRERATQDFSLKFNLPLITENCPACYEKPTQRQHMKELLKKEENNNPNLFKTLLSTMRPLMRSNEIKNLI